MLTLAHPHSAHAVLVLHRVGGWQLGADLQRYVQHALSNCWPKAELVCVTAPSDLQRKDMVIWLCGEAPEPLTQRPALLLGAVARNPRLVRIDEQLWSCATPLNAQILIRHIERVLQQSTGRA